MNQTTPKPSRGYTGSTPTQNAPFGPIEKPKKKPKTHLPLLLDPFAQKVLLYDVLTQGLPKVPPAVSFAKSGKPSTDTRDPCDADWELGPADQLVHLVPYPPMMDVILPKIKALLKEYSFDAQNLWLNRLTPESRLFHHPAQICSEHDTTDLVLGGLWRPSVAIVQYCKYGSIEPQLFPNVSSIGGTAPVPDLMLFNTPTDRERYVRAATGEIKTHSVLNVSIQEELAAITESWKGMPLGRSLRFFWPIKGETNLPKLTKVIVQVWSQMVHHKVNYAMLSSYQCTYFFARRPEDQNTLFISRAYSEQEAAAATLAFTAVALGELVKKEDFKLPPVSTKHWPAEGMQRPPGSGIHPATLPQAYRGETEKPRNRPTGFKDIDDFL
ncbi:hypothetical protein HGRIS_001865 [Hohenbuehelia grisea]|uniref:Uncharacterized protein n=1 Tax=Hohenbuehelia grisea TaxID=104357 RepID=A0ABR3JIV8_9AGAR